MTLAELEQRWPFITWREPLPVAWQPAGRSDAAHASGGQTFACRICIASFGLKRNSDHQFATEQQAREHIKRHTQ